MDDLVLVSGKIGTPERTAIVSIRQSVARYLNPHAAARKWGRTVGMRNRWAQQCWPTPTGPKVG